MRLIDADRLHESYAMTYKGIIPDTEMDRMAHAIAAQPTIDVAPMMHGQWKPGESGLVSFCTMCHNYTSPKLAKEWNYCPYCGAKMEVK